jgi:hypothetical protein
MGFRVVGLTFSHLHLQIHFTSLTDHHVVPYLVDFMIMGSGLTGSSFHVLVFRDRHIAPKSSTIYISIPDFPKFYSSYMNPSNRHAIPHLSIFMPHTIVGSRVRGFPGSQKISSHIFPPSVPTTIAPFPMHIYYYFNSNNLPNKFEGMVINK